MAPPLARALAQPSHARCDNNDAALIKRSAEAIYLFHFCDAKQKKSHSRYRDSNAQNLQLLKCCMCILNPVCAIKNENWDVNLSWKAIKFR